MGTWFWYHLKAKNALSLNMATNGAAFLSIVPRRKKHEKKIHISFVFCVLRANEYFFCNFKAIFEFFSQFCIRNMFCFYSKRFLWGPKIATKE